MTFRRYEGIWDAWVVMLHGAFVNKKTGLEFIYSQPKFGELFGE